MKQVVGISFLADGYWSPFTPADTCVTQAKAELFTISEVLQNTKPSLALDSKGKDWLFNLGALYPNDKMYGICSWMLSSNDLLYVLDRNIASLKTDTNKKQAYLERKELIVKTIQNDFKDQPDIIEQFSDYRE